MLYGIATVIVFGIIALYFDGARLIKEKLNRDFAIFVTILLVGVVLAILKVVKVDLPTPLKGIEFVYKPLTDFISGMLE